MKHAESTNESENEDEPPRLEQDQTVMFMKKPQEKAQWSSGTVVSVDGQRSYTLEDDATGTQYSRDRVHIKPIPGYAPTPPTANASSERREGASVPVEIPVEMPSTKATASPPKPEPETPVKQKADNPSESNKTSRTRCIIRAIVKC